MYQTIGGLVLLAASLLAVGQSAFAQLNGGNGQNGGIGTNGGNGQNGGVGGTGTNGANGISANGQDGANGISANGQNGMSVFVNNYIHRGLGCTPFDPRC